MSMPLSFMECNKYHCSLMSLRLRWRWVLWEYNRPLLHCSCSQGSASWPMTSERLLQAIGGRPECPLHPCLQPQCPLDTGQASETPSVFPPAVELQALDSNPI